MPPRASSRGDAGRRKHGRKQFTASPFGAPFSFGTPLRLNSQPPPRSKRGQSPGAPRRVLDVLDDEDPRGSRPNVGGYGVTAPGRYPDLDAPFVSISEQSKAPAPGAAAPPRPPQQRARRGSPPGTRRRWWQPRAPRPPGCRRGERGRGVRQRQGRAARRREGGTSRGLRRGLPPTPHRRGAGAAGRRADIAAAATSRRSRRFRRSARDGSDSDSSSDSGSAGSGDVKEDGGANAGAFGAGPDVQLRRTHVARSRRVPVVGSRRRIGRVPRPGRVRRRLLGAARAARPRRHLREAPRHAPRRRRRGEPETVDETAEREKAEKTKRGCLGPAGRRRPGRAGAGPLLRPRALALARGRIRAQFSFGGGKDDIGKLRTPGPHDTPGPGAYHADAPATAASAGRARPPPRSSPSAGASGLTGHPPGRGKTRLRPVRTSGTWTWWAGTCATARTARGGAPSFTFGGGPLRDEPSAAAARAPTLSPGPASTPATRTAIAKP